MPKISITRQTKETQISLELDLYGKGQGTIDTGIGFFDHMLKSFCIHGGFDLSVACCGDLDVDTHHTVEDIGIVLGNAFSKALGDKKGINRFGNSFVPMDEALVQCTVDLSGRAYDVFNCPKLNDYIGDFESCMLWEFFRAFSQNAQMTLHINVLYGKNSHHIAEACFKSLARALKEACLKSGRDDVLSAKGVL